MSEKSKLMRQCEILSRGISDEAMRTLEELVSLDLPVFQLREPDGTPIASDASTLALHAAVRDGEQGLVKQIVKMRKLANQST